MTVNLFQLQREIYVVRRSCANNDFIVEVYVEEYDDALRVGWRAVYLDGLLFGNDQYD